MKTFSVSEMFLIKSPVTKFRILLLDKRTEEYISSVVYYPGIEFPTKQYGDFIQTYGYELKSCEKEKTVKGVVPWDQIFDLIAQKENEYD